MSEVAANTDCFADLIANVLSGHHQKYDEVKKI